MHTSKYHASGRGLLALIASSALAIQASASVLLVDYVLPGTQSTVAWESPALSNSNPAGTPTFGTGTIDPITPGYHASAGYYSWMGDFGATASTSAAFDIQNVVFQLVMMQNPDFSIYEILNYDGNYLPGFSPEAGYTGGPILNYNGGTQGIQATLSAVVAGPSYETIGPMEGDVASFAWQWDLSGITDEISSISITAPIPIHQSTVEARIDSSNVYTQVVPEPSTYAAILGLATLGVAMILRRRKLSCQ